MEKFTIFKDLSGNNISGTIAIVPESFGEYELEEIREHLSEEMGRFNQLNDLDPSECKTYVQPIININGVEIQNESIEVRLAGDKSTAYIQLATPVIPFRWTEKYALKEPSSRMLWLPVQVFKGPNKMGYKGLGALWISLTPDEERQAKMNKSFGRSESNYRETVVSIIVEHNLVNA